MSRTVLGFALATGGLLVLGTSCFLDPYRSLTQVDDRVTLPSSADCAECHVEIAREFRASRHATAWSDPAFVAATSGRAFSDCLGCHAPLSVYTAGEPALRNLHRDDGVTCVSCHFDGEVLAGPAPRSALMKPHPIAEERPLYRSSELCAKCHEGTFAEWSAAPAEGRRTCQDCHMRPVSRTLTQATGAFSKVLVSFEDSFAGRAHSFDVAAIGPIEDAFDVALARVERGDTSLALTVALTSKVPHLVPTGDFGFRRVRVALAAFGSEATAIASGRFDLYKEQGASLVCGVPREFELVAPVSTTAVTITVSALDRDGHEVSVIERRLLL